MFQISNNTTPNIYNNTWNLYIPGKKYFVKNIFLKLFFKSIFLCIFCNIFLKIFFTKYFSVHIFAIFFWPNLLKLLVLDSPSLF